MHTFKLPARIALLCLGGLFLFVACKKEIGETNSIASSREDVSDLTVNQMQTSKSGEDITQKVKAAPIGTTKIVQFKSGVYFGVEKSKVAQRFVVINGGKTYYPAFPTVVTRSIIKNFRIFSLWGTIHIFIEIGDCDYYIDINEKTGEVISVETWCS